VVNYCDPINSFTRIIEHKHFEFGKMPGTVITKEYPVLYTPKSEPFYPVNDLVNDKKYPLYKELKKTTPNVIFGGRLAEFRYYDMHQIIASSLSKVKKEFSVPSVLTP